MASAINEEEDNFLRFYMLLGGPGTEAVRLLFDSFFPNNTLDSVLRREENNIRRRAKQWRITQKQLHLIFPAVGKATSKEFDITLLIGLIRNFINKIGYVVIPTNNNWESVPDPKDIEKGDDLARIKFYRNEMAHSKDNTLDMTTFKSHWKTVKEAISRLSGSCLDERSVQLETMRLDDTNEVKKNIRNLKADLIEYVNELRIPGRDAQSLEIEMWEKGHSKFVKTDAVDAVINALQVKDCVTVVGSFGQGKSSLIQHIALLLRDKEGYQIIPCRDPKEIQTWYEREKKQIFIVDDLYGERSLLHSKLESWQDHAQFIKMILRLGMVKIVASSRLYIFNDANSKFQIDVFQNVIDLKTKPLSTMQKQELLKMHIPSIDELAIKSILEMSDADTEDHFPLLCLMYTNYRTSSTLSNTLDIRDFFCNRKRIHEDFLDSLKKHDKNSYKTILLFVLLDGKVCRKEYSNENRFLSQEVKSTDLTKYLEIDKYTFYKCLENLTGTFFMKSRDIFLPMHASILDTLLTFCARVSQQIIIQHLKSSVLFRHSNFTNINTYTSDILIVVNPENENSFFQRMLTELEKRKIFKVFDQHSMSNILFRQKFVEFIRSESSKNHQLVKRILNTKDEAKMEGTVPILPIQIASYRGWADMVEMLVAYVDFNFYGIVGFSALHAACVLGEINTVKVLINSGANVNKTAKLGHVLSVFNRYFRLQLCSPINQFKGLSEKAEISPIYLACAYKHTSVVKLLLENNASIHTGDNLVDTDTAPYVIQSYVRNNHRGYHLLVRALLNGDSDMINLLLDYGARLVINFQCQPLDIPLD